MIDFGSQYTPVDPAIRCKSSAIANALRPLAGRPEVQVKLRNPNKEDEESKCPRIFDRW